jgi:O-Antigen ligase
MAFVVLARHSRAGRAPKSWRLLILGFVVIGGTALLFSTALVDKITRAGLFDSNRLAMYRVTLRSILDRPLFGWGYGTFIDVFPMYRDGSIGGSGTWSQAHNTYLEAVQGLGVVFGSIFAALIALLLFHCFRGAAMRRENATVPRLAVAVGILVGTHALVDFSLQIQAVTLTVAALLGAGLAQAESSRVCLNDGMAGSVYHADGRGAYPQAPRTGAGWQTRSSVLAVSIFCGYAALQGWQLAASAALEREIDQGPPTPAAETVPGTSSATARHWLGIPGLGPSAFDLPLAQIASLDPETGRQLAAELTALLAVRPLSSRAWLSLAVFRLVAREEPTSVIAALRISWLTGPREGGVLWQRGVFGLALWEFLPTDTREWTARDLARAMLEGLVADAQMAAIAPVLGARSAEARTQIGVLLEKHGLGTADLTRIGLLHK